MSAQPTALVTGSTKGIGKAIAKRLLREDYQVALNYAADEKSATETLESFKRISPHVMLVKADIGSPDESCELIARVIAKFGALDVLVNNAALVADRPALEMTLDEWNSVLDVNLRGAFLCSQAAGRQMLNQESGGTILNIGASTGIRARRNGVNTCASKAGLMIMTQCFALELAPQVRVNSIVPGTIVTNETVGRFGLSDPSVRRQREEGIPLQRLGRPEDVADTVMLMLSNESRFITGQKIVVDGGQNMW